MSITKWFIRKIVPSGLIAVLAAYLTALFTKPEASMMVGLYGMAIICVGGVAAILVDGTISFVQRISFQLARRPTAKINFPIPSRGKNVSLEIHNFEKRLELLDISVRLYDIEQFPDKFGKSPIEQRMFDNRYFGIGHKQMNDRKLSWKEGGGTKSGEVFVPAGQSVFFYLFELDEYGSMGIPQIKLRLDKFPKGSYLFDFEFTGYVEKKRTPDYVSVSVRNTGEEIIVENIESRL